MTWTNGPVFNFLVNLRRFLLHLRTLYLQLFPYSLFVGAFSEYAFYDLTRQSTPKRFAGSFSVCATLLNGFGFRYDLPEAMKLFSIFSCYRL